MQPAHPPRSVRHVTILLVLGAVLLLCGSFRPASADDAAAPVPGDDLRLVVLVIIDQWRGDSLDRYERVFGPDGFRRLLEGGVWYQNAFFDHAHTVTAPGHATIGTGANPAAHGIVGNDWIDRRTGQRVGCVGDAASPIVGATTTTGAASPVQLISTTFSDEWIFATAGRARAFGVSGKDRGAILPVGRTGKAFWYHGASGRMVSSRYYYSELPAWVSEFNRVTPAEKYAGKSWERATRNDDGVPSALDDRSFEGGSSGIGRTFPHRLAQGERGRGAGQGLAAGGGGAAQGTGGGGAAQGTVGRPESSSDDRADSSAVNDPERGGAAEDGERTGGGSGRGGGFGRGGTFGRGFGARLSDQVLYTPFGDQIVLDFALTLARAEELGRRNALDVLAISLSANDFVGHSFGPDSVEAKEMAYSLDRGVAQLLHFLDENVGTERYLLVLASDHGVAYPPEAVSAVGFAAKRYSHTEMARKIRRRLSFIHRYLEWDAGFSASGFYLDPEAVMYGGATPESLEKSAAEVIRATSGIAAAYTRSDILAGRLPDTDLARRVLAAYHTDRSPDVFLVPEPYWIEGTSAASHGTPHRYDAHVPLIVYGAGLKAGRVQRAISMRSLAPTLTAILGCAAPSASQGEPLPEILDGVTRKPLRK